MNNKEEADLAWMQKASWSTDSFTTEIYLRGISDFKAALIQATVKELNELELSLRKVQGNYLIRYKSQIEVYKKIIDLINETKPL